MFVLRVMFGELCQAGNVWIRRLSRLEFRLFDFSCSLICNPMRHMPGEDAARGWLEDGEESGCSRHGFSVEDLSAHSYTQHRIYRGKQKPIRFSMLELEGTLTVLEPDSFRTNVIQRHRPRKGLRLRPVAGAPPLNIVLSFDGTIY